MEQKNNLSPAPSQKEKKVVYFYDPALEKKGPPKPGEPRAGMMGYDSPEELKRAYDDFVEQQRLEQEQEAQKLSTQQQSEKLEYRAGFLSPDEIEKLRQDQVKFIEDIAEDARVNGGDEFDVDIAKGNAFNKIDDIAIEYVEGRGVKPEDPNYTELINWVKKYSIAKMTDEEWEQGLVDMNSGKRLSSGKSLVEEAHDDFVSEQKAAGIASPNALVEPEKLDLGFLDPDRVEELRKAQRNLRLSEARKVNWSDKKAIAEAEKKADAQFDDLIDAYLQSAGVEESKRDEYRKILREYSIDVVDDTAWWLGSESNPTGRDNLRDARSRLAGASPVPPPAPPVAPAPVIPVVPVPPAPPIVPPAVVMPPVAPAPPRSPESRAIHEALVKEAKERLEEARDKLAAKAAKRQGRLRSTGNTEKEYDDLTVEYEERIYVLAALEQWSSPMVIARRLLDEEKLLHDKTYEELNNTKLARFIQFMNEGGKIKRMAKGAVVGAVGAAFGLVTAAMVAGTGGAGAVALGVGFGAAIGGAGKIIRGIAAAEGGKRGKEAVAASPKELAELQSYIEGEVSQGLSKADYEEALIQAALERHQEARETYTTEQQRARLKALGKAALIAGLSYAVGAGAHELLDSILGHVNGPSVARAVPSSPSAPVAPHEILPSTPTPAYEFTSQEINISSGEGWFTKFEEMGVPKEQWSSLLDKLGPKLHDIQGSDGTHLAYLDRASGEWRMNMMPDGKMPQEALDLISREANLHPSGTSVAEVLQHGGGRIDNVPSGGGGVVNQLAQPGGGNFAGITHGGEIVPGDISGDVTGRLQDIANIRPGQGGEQFVGKLGLRPQEWYNLTKSVNLLEGPYKEYFYRMPNGNIGFAKPGRLPDKAMAYLLNNLNKGRFGLAA